jgi:tripartite-type tricarboxylate transporter receptor subunit TctC
VPTYQEQGIKIALDQWLGVLLPAGTPPAIATRLNAEMNKALTVPAVRDVFVNSAQDPVGGTAEHLARLLREDFDKYARLSKELNIKVD